MRKKFYIVCLVCVLSGIFGVSVAKNDSRSFEISRNLDIYNSLFKELNMAYVDTVDVEKAVSDAIQAMLGHLDPYTVYIPEKEKEDFVTSTTGEYAGIGSFIMQRDGAVYISEPYEGMPAQLGGLRAGDKLVMIDKDTVTGWSSAKVSERLKGPANTPLTVTVSRPGVEGLLSFDLRRKKIHMNAVVYYGVLEECPKTGYIALSSFTESSAQEVKKAFLDLKQKGIESLVLDLRGNGGGVLECAVQIINYFVPKGVEVLSTRGRQKQTSRIYKTTQEPLDAHIPLAVLIDGNSASASEIVAGALQDLDRAVVLGMRSFGKGLVQSTRTLPYNGLLKVTIARYYIPSGRCIQAYDYRHLNPDGSAKTLPDSLTKAFKTAGGREVRDGGGIKPDVVITPDSLPSIVYDIATSDVLLDYVNHYVQTHATIAPAGDFSLTDADYADFVKMVEESDFTYKRRTEEMMKLL